MGRRSKVNINKSKKAQLMNKILKLRKAGLAYENSNGTDRKSESVVENQKENDECWT